MNSNPRYLSLLVCLTLASISAACAPAASTQLPEPTLAPVVSVPTSTPETWIPTRAPLVPTSAASAGEAVQTTAKNIPAEARVGQLKVDYPSLLLPGNSKTIEVSVYVPLELAGADPQPFSRELIPTNPEPLPGAYDHYRALIFLTRSMRIELIAPGLGATELYPAVQNVDTETPNQITHWAWSVLAPQQPGEYIATVRIFLHQETSPRWVGSFSINVAQLTPTATPIPNPLDTAKTNLEKIAAIIAAISAVAAAIAGLVKLAGGWKKKEK